MKRTDDFGAKLLIWAEERKVYPMPKAVGIPHFGAKKFRSYDELNAWKKDLMVQIAAAGGLKWTK